MPAPTADYSPEPFEIRRRALSRWENEGGSIAPPRPLAPSDAPDLTNAELVQLRIRLIALENVLIAVLAEGSEGQLQVARQMANYIAPRQGFTCHPLTTQAAKHITHLVDRAIHFRSVVD
jgi:hypothetical protein